MKKKLFPTISTLVTIFSWIKQDNSLLFGWQNMKKISLSESDVNKVGQRKVPEVKRIQLKHAIIK